MLKLKTFIYEEQINLLDEEFIYRVFNDIEQFLKENSGRCVLIFPPLNNRRRYYIHRVGQIFNVQTFSVGEGLRRFTVVCSFEKEINQVDETATQVMDPVRVKKGAISKSKRAPRPDAPIYVPPAIRRGQKTQPSEQKNKPQITQKQCDDPTENFEISSDKKGKDVAINSNVSIEKIDKAIESTADENVPSESEIDENISNKYEINEKIPIKSEIDEKILNKSVIDEKIPNKSEIDEKIPNKSEIDEKICNKCEIIESSTVISEETTQNNDSLNTTDDENVTNVPTEKSDTQNKSAININNNIGLELINESYPTIKNDELCKIKNIYDNKDNDQEQEEMFRASEEFNRRNKKIIKQSYNKSDVLIISDLKKSETAQDKQHKLVENKKTNESKAPVESWEDLLDDGKLDSDLMLEIKMQVGNVKISNAKEDYREYGSKSILNGDFSHVVEIFDFPKEFQTRDLVTIIDSFTNGTYHIKWVDDNHALGVFSSGFVVNELLKIKHPLLKLRSMGEASKQSAEKAMRYPNTMMPSAVRAQTCPQAARRMITGALGLKLNNAKEERAQEIKILKEARAKKRLSVKQQDDAWEGNTSSS